MRKHNVLESINPCNLNSLKSISYLDDIWSRKHQNINKNFVKHFLIPVYVPDST
jgi:hypothetical protein